MIAHMMRGPMHGRIVEVAENITSYSCIEKCGDQLRVHTYVRAPQFGFFIHDPTQTTTRPPARERDRLT